MDTLSSLFSKRISMLLRLSLLTISSALSITYFGVSIFNVRAFHSMIGNPCNPFLGFWKLFVWGQGLLIVGLYWRIIQRLLDSFIGRPQISVTLGFFLWLNTFFSEESLILLLSVGWSRVNGKGHKPGCWCSGSRARVRSWGISSFRMESFSNPSVSSSMPAHNLCCAWCAWACCLFGQLLQKINFPSLVGGREKGSGMSLIFALLSPSLSCSEIPDALIPQTLLDSVASCWLPVMGTWASAVSSLLSHLSLVHSLSIFQKDVDTSHRLSSLF